MKYRLRSLFVVAALIAVLLCAYRVMRQRAAHTRAEAIAYLHSSGVILVTSSNRITQAETYVSTNDDLNFEINGERFTKADAKAKLAQIRRHAERIDAVCVMTVDNEPGQPSHSRKSSAGLVHSVGCGACGMGVFTYDSRKQFYRARNQLFEPN